MAINSLNGCKMIQIVMPELCNPKITWFLENKKLWDEEIEYPRVAIMECYP